MMKTTKVPFCKYVENEKAIVKPRKEVVVYMDHKAIPKLEKSKTKMEAHASCENHIRHLEAELTAKKDESSAHQLQ